MGDGRRETGLELLRNQGLLTEAAGRLETKPASDGRTTKGKTGLRGVHAGSSELDARGKSALPQPTRRS